MAKTKTRRRRRTLGRYFRELFEANPDWLDLKSNDLIQARFEQDFPNKKFSPKIRANVANIKSVMRKQKREGGKSKPGRRPKAAANSTQAVEALEVAIDSCLSTARDMNDSRLAPVIVHLREARNRLVWNMGKP